MPTANLLLASLSPSDAVALFPHLKSVHLAQQKVLFEAGDPLGPSISQPARLFHW